MLAVSGSMASVGAHGGAARELLQAVGAQLLPGTTGFSPHSEHISIISNCSLSPRTSRRQTEHILSVSFM